MSKIEDNHERWDGELSSNYLDSISTNKRKLDAFLQKIQPEIVKATAKIEIKIIET